MRSSFLPLMLLIINMLLIPLRLKGEENPLRPAGFAEKAGYLTGDTAIIIPAHITHLPPYAFAGTDGLRRVSFAPGATCSQIGEYAFAECPDLEEIILPPSLTGIGEGAWRECRKLRTLEIPSGVREIPKEMCLRCESLGGISLPAGLTKIGSFAFSGCYALRQIALPARLTSIGSNAFSDCRSLRRILIPTGVATIESYAFSGCRNLESCTLPPRKDMLGELIFADCPSLVELTIMSPVPPPFECESFPFEPFDEGAYARCRLHVPSRAVSCYRSAHGWNLFINIH